MNSESAEPDGTIIDLDPDQVTVERDATVSAKPAPNKRGLRWIASLAALALAAIGGGWLYRDVLSNYFPSDQMSQTIERTIALDKANMALQEQMHGLERIAGQLKTDVDALETKATSAAGTATAASDALSGTYSRITSVEADIAKTKQTLADFSTKLAAAPQPGITATPDTSGLISLAARVETLEKDLAALKAGVAEKPDMSVLSQSLSDLKAKIAAGTAYDLELDRIQRIVPAAEGLDVLKVHAEKGLPDAKGLAAELTMLAAQLPKPESAAFASADDSLWTRSWNAISDLIKIREAGEADWPVSAAAAAEIADTGDLKQAIDKLATIEAAKPAPLQQWLDRANGRLVQEAALQSVSNAVLRVIAASQSSSQAQ